MYDHTPGCTSSLDAWSVAYSLYAQQWTDYTYMWGDIGLVITLFGCSYRGRVQAARYWTCTRRARQRARYGTPL